MLDKLKEIDRFFVGLDRVSEQVSKLTAEAYGSNYPPFNLKKLNDTSYEIELAVAGFDIDDIDIELTKGSLVVKGSLESPKDEVPTYLWKGISNRSFTRSFVLSDSVKVKSAELKKGILVIKLESIKPKEETTKIKIN